MFNYITVEFPESQTPPQRVVEFSFSQAHASHEIAYLKFRDWDVSYKNIKTGSPITFTLRTTGASRVFYGYVQTITPKITPGKRLVEMSVIGASYKLKQTRQAVYTNVTASDVVKQIATLNSFSYSVEDHPRVYEQVAQAGHSDLELLTRVAMQAGYSLRIENTTIYFRPYDFDYKNFRQSAPILTLRNTNDPEGTDIYFFNATVSESLMYENGYVKASPSVAGVDGSGKAIQVTRDNILTFTKSDGRVEFFDVHATNVVAPDLKTAFYEAKAIEKNTGYPYRATVSVQGNPLLRPDAPVFLDGLGSDYSGYWTVLETNHIVVEESRNQFKYVTHMIVGTDSLGGQSPQYTDVTEVPSLQDVRILVPGKRSTPDYDTTVLDTTNTPVNEQAEFVRTKNGITKATKQGVKKLASWKNTKKNLAGDPVRLKRRSKISVDRLKNK